MLFRLVAVSAVVVVISTGSYARHLEDVDPEENNSGNIEFRENKLTIWIVNSAQTEFEHRLRTNVAYIYD